MGLEEYTTEQLREEIKRRNEILKQEKLKEKRCRNCVHFDVDTSKGFKIITCAARTFTMKGREWHYSVRACNKACDKYENKLEKE